MVVQIPFGDVLADPILFDARQRLHPGIAVCANFFIDCIELTLRHVTTESARTAGAGSSKSAALFLYFHE
jgi:hypothetical protein